MHQLAQAELLFALRRAAPPHLRVLGAPLDVTFGATRRLQPDLVVLDREQLRGATVDGLPLLAVEVLSPSSRATDLTLKRHVFEQAGVPSYWLLDPDVPSLTVLELSGGAYREVAVVIGGQAHEATLPFPVRVVPAELVR